MSASMMSTDLEKDKQVMQAYQQSTFDMQSEQHHHHRPHSFNSILTMVLLKLHHIVRPSNKHHSR